MVVSKLTCPACAAHLTSAKPPRAGTQIRCPRCGAHFPVSVAACNPPTPRREDSRPQGPSSQIQDLRGDVYNRGERNGPAFLQEFFREPEEPADRPVRHRAYILGGGLVLLVALGITMAVAISTSSSPPASIKLNAPLGPRPDQGSQREAAAPLPVPSRKAGTPKPEPDPKGAKADEPPREAATVLVPGEPSLTQDFLDRWLAYTEGLLEIRLYQQQRRECQHLWVERWKETNQLGKDRFWAYANAELKWWSEVAKQSEAERAELRAEARIPFLASLRKSSDRDERLLLELYVSAHEPGRERNPILVASTPPLTQEMVDQGRRLIQWILDVRLTAPQRQEYQQLFVNNWKTWPQVVKDTYFKGNFQGVLTQLPQMSPYARDLLRAQRQSQLLADLQKSSGDELAGLLLAVHESAHRPGGERNPVLVRGKPPLTRDMVGQFGDFVEWGLNLRVRGGLTVSQRQMLRDFLMESWEKRDDSWKATFVEQLRKWRVLVGLSDVESARLQEQLHPALVAQLRRTPNQLNHWLLEISSKEQQR